MSKQITEEGLRKDLEYLVYGIEVHYVLFSIVFPEPSISVLEPGCGSGKLGLAYAVRGAHVTLLDYDSEAIKYAQMLRDKAVVVARRPIEASFVVGSVFEMPESWTNSFDFVFNEGVPHHWGYDPHDIRRQQCINEMVRVTKLGGKTCVIGSNAHCAATMRMAETVAHTYPGMPPRQKPFNNVELKDRLKEAGLTDIWVRAVTGWPGGILSDSPLLAGYGVKL